MPLKITTWNLNHADRLVANNPSSATLNRRQRVRVTIEEIAPDILCLQEGPKGEQTIDAFCTQVLQDNWRPALLRQPAEALGAQDFDLLSNLQGDVIVAEQFLQHVLTRLPAHLRWSARFADEILGRSAANNPLRLDHLLVSRHLLGGALPRVLNRQACLVEHEAYESHNAGANNATRTSDHRPVTCRLDPSLRTFSVSGESFAQRRKSRTRKKSW